MNIDRAKLERLKVRLAVLEAQHGGLLELRGEAASRLQRSRADFWTGCGWPASDERRGLSWSALQKLPADELQAGRIDPRALPLLAAAAAELAGYSAQADALSGRVAPLRKLVKRLREFAGDVTYIGTSA